MVFLICFEQNADFLQETISFGASSSENKESGNPYHNRGFSAFFY
jgi:hypothetical protein